MKIIIGLFMILLLNIDCSSQKRTYTNPVMSGFYPDPSVCRVGDDYYLVNSTFAYFPGLPIFHSKNLVNWKNIGHILDRPEQLDLEGAITSGGLYAPAIHFHNGLFYVTCTNTSGKGNFVVTAKNPAGPWSNPVYLPEVNGIDPSLIFDADGKSYIVYNSVAPDEKPLYEGHRTIRINEFDAEHLKVISDNKVIVNGGVDFSKKPIWIEGPHIYKIDKWYYLMAAEGGTAEDHSEVIFRSTNIMGPYTAYENNPILTQRHLDPARKNAITSTGHADLIQTQNGDWWAVFLGCRPYKPYEDGFYNTGRETFMTPVKWKNGWPIINPDFEEVQHFYTHPFPDLASDEPNYYSGNFSLTDEFNDSTLNPDWIFLRTPKEKWFNLEESKLKIKLRPETCSGLSNPSLIARRQQHAIGTASASMEFKPEAENEKAGLLAFQNEDHFYYMCKSVEAGNSVIQLYKSNPDAENDMELIASEKIGEKKNADEVQFKIDADEDKYTFSYKAGNEDWKVLMKDADGKFISTDIPRDFCGGIFAMYCTSLGKTSENEAVFNWFSYTGNDEIYRKK
ncbi:MAG: glycoside hydrolase family 43 protein [Ignavibacteria bacterium]|nr:glycoside hydrolase family 43 protein [Ignavibacteria bacterium]